MEVVYLGGIFLSQEDRMIGRKSGTIGYQFGEYVELCGNMVRCTFQKWLCLGNSELDIVVWLYPRRYPLILKTHEEYVFLDLSLHSFSTTNDPVSREMAVPRSSSAALAFGVSSPKCRSSIATGVEHSVAIIL